ncbi:MAG TPA: hypothetical protein PLX41_11365 [Bacteroidales bacterium]|nr:hypothetical protein [Bacteroidales bacterium]
MSETLFNQIGFKQQIEDIEMLRELILKNKQNVTTLIVIYVVMEDYISGRTQQLALPGLSVAEIGKKYGDIANRFNRREKFSPTYVQRHAGNHGFVEEHNGKFLIKEALVHDIRLADLQELSQLILSLLTEQNALYQGFFQELERRLIENDPGSQRDFILSLFDENRFRNYGQVFEVLSYSILKVYFESFGFGLKRFSVSFSNDGGMDFLSSNGVYQVTSSPSTQKIRGDLGKLPGIPRVMVLSRCSSIIRELCMNSGIVTEIITTNDLKSHFINWLYERDKLSPVFMKSIITTIREEMIRETT